MFWRVKRGSNKGEGGLGSWVEVERDEISAVSREVIDDLKGRKKHSRSD